MREEGLTLRVAAQARAARQFGSRLRAHESSRDIRKGETLEATQSPVGQGSSSAWAACG
jgi:hypothetical protein